MAYLYTDGVLSTESQIPSPIVIVQPDIEPVSLEELKRNLRVDEDMTDQDDELADLITGGRQYVERFTGLSLIDQTFEITLDAYPDNGIIRLKAPLLSIVSFEYSDTDGVYTTLAASQYLVDSTGSVPRILPGYSVTWPDTLARSGSVRIRWRAGFADRTSPIQGTEMVPVPLKSAIKLYAEAYFDRDEKMMEMLLKRVDSLCQTYCINHGFA